MRCSCPPTLPCLLLLALFVVLAPAACKPADEPASSGTPAGQPEAVETTSNETTSNQDPWGAMPKTVNPFYFTEFEEWVGKPISSQELARLMNRPIPSELNEGRSFLMFYRSDCEHCHHMLEEWFTESVPATTIAVQVPDTDPANAMPFPTTLVKRHTLPKGPDYVISTPALFAIKDGMVTGFASDPEQPETVETCISSNAD